jgi:hypothetical protein
MIPHSFEPDAAAPCGAGVANELAACRLGAAGFAGALSVGIPGTTASAFAREAAGKTTDIAPDPSDRVVSPG